jgi:hypothetical protein
VAATAILLVLLVARMQYPVDKSVQCLGREAFFTHRPNHTKKVCYEVGIKKMVRQRQLR